MEWKGRLLGTMGDCEATRQQAIELAKELASFPGLVMESVLGGVFIAQHDGRSFLVTVTPYVGQLMTYERG